MPKNTITFPVIEGTKDRRNAETGIEIHNDGKDGYAIVIPAVYGDRYLFRATLAEARAAAIIEVEYMRVVIAEAYVNAMATAPATTEPVIVLVEKVPGLVKLAVAGFPGHEVNIVKANGSWYAGIDGVTIGAGHRKLEEAMRGLSVHFARRIKAGLMPVVAITPTPDPQPTRKRGMTVASRINTGELIEGQRVSGVTVGVHPTGRVAFRSTWSGVFDGTRLDEGTMYHFFRDGEINGLEQRLHGFPVSHLTA